MNRKHVVRNKIVVMVTVLLVLVIGLGSVSVAEPGSSSQNVETQQKKIAQSSDKETGDAAPLDLQMTLSCGLFRGDKVKLELGELNGSKKITAYSSNPKVATISGSGIIHAKKCGTAALTLCLSDPAAVKTLQLKVKVTKCSYRSRKKVSLYIGEKQSISAVSKTSGAKVSIQSGNSKVISLKGKTLKAKKKGSCQIKATVKKGEKSASLTIVLKAAKAPKLKVTNKMKDAWFKNSIMAGHSVGIGFQMFCQSQYKGFLGNARHISVGSYGVYNDMAPVTGSSLHPTVNGRKARLKDHVKALGAKKVFINYGLNDIGARGADEFVKNYKKLINELLKENPKTTVYIVSPTPMYSDRGMLTNANMRISNKALKKYAKKKKRVEFIDVYTPMLDESGKLRAEYCSDAYCHITTAGYTKYSSVLKAFAKKKIIEETDQKDAAFTEKEAKKTGR